MRTPITSTCLLTILLCIQANSTMAFSRSSSTTNMRRQRFNDLVMKSNIQAEDMSGLFPGKGPYVPAGLSQEEYAKLKKKESDEISKKNFGAWGPRFKQTDTPDGDWMVMPSLWTNGINARARPAVVASDGGDAGMEGQGSMWRRIPIFIKRNGLGLLLTYIMLDLLVAAITMYRWAATGGVSGGLVSLPSTKGGTFWQMFLHGLVKKKSLLAFTVLQTLIAEFALSGILGPITNAFLEKMNRRQLWTKRRTFFTICCVGFVALTAWATGMSAFFLFVSNSSF